MSSPTIGLTTGTTVTNPNDSLDRYINVQLHVTGQIVKAVPIFSLQLDSREQTANVKAGTEVVLLHDGISSFFIIGSSNQACNLSGQKNYIIENADAITLLTNKSFTLSAINGGLVDNATIKAGKFQVVGVDGELVSLISDALNAYINTMVVTDHGARPITDGSKNAMSAIKSKIDSFKP